MKNKMILYSIGNIAAGLLNAAFSTFIIFFYVDKLKMPAALIGIGMAIYGIWNAINDPILGYISDRTNTRWGRRIPYIKFGAVPFVLAFFFVWTPPVNLLKNNTTLIFIYFMIFIFLYDCFYTLIFLNYSALYPTMFKSPEDRTKASTFKQWFAITSTLIGTALTPILYGGLGWKWMAFIYAVISIISIRICLKGCFETKESISENTLSVAEALKATFKNKSFLLFVLSNTMIQLTFVLLQAGMPFYAKYVLKVNDIKTSALLGTIFISALFFIKLWGNKANRIGNKKTFIQCVALFGFTLIPLWFIQNFTFALIATTLIGVGLSGILILLDLILAAIIDEDETKTGLRREGMYYGANAFIMRLGISLQSIIMGFTLKFTNYDADLSVGAQPASALIGIRSMITIIPIVAIVIAVVLISFYSESKSKLGSIKAVNYKRNSEG